MLTNFFIILIAIIVLPTLIVFWVSFAKMLMTRLKQEELKPVSREALPHEIQAVFQGADEALGELGFRFSYAVENESAIVSDKNETWNLNYRYQPIIAPNAA